MAVLASREGAKQSPLLCLLLVATVAVCGALGWPQTSNEYTTLSNSTQTITTLISSSLYSGSSPTSGAISPAQSSSSSSHHVSNLTVQHQRKPPIKLRFLNRQGRPEFCREALNARKAEDLPSLVVIARIKEIYGNFVEHKHYHYESTSGSGSAADIGSSAAQVASSSSSTSSFTPIRTLVSVGRVVKGNQDLAGSDIMIKGFNASSNSSPCPNNIHVNDTWILLLEPDAEDRLTYVIASQQHMLSMNLQNLDLINSIALDEPLKRRGPIEDILCEKHYCPYGRCKLVEPNGVQLTCACPESCPPLSAPVCGSDNATYINECQLIVEGCKQRRPLFVTKESAC